MNEQQHNMILGKTLPSGAEEWYCPTCGRSLLVNWEPKFTKSVLQAGDEFAVHSGAKGNLHIAPVQVLTEDELIMQEPDELFPGDIWLSPWIEWMDKVGFENRWNE